jgi:hypothetical protein
VLLCCEPVITGHCLLAAPNTLEVHYGEPVENCWSKVKSILRSRKPRTLDDLLEALTEAFASIPLQDILSWFRHCGYRVAST